MPGREHDAVRLTKRELDAIREIEAGLRVGGMAAVDDDRSRCRRERNEHALWPGITMILVGSLAVVVFLTAWLPLAVLATAVVGGGIFLSCEHLRARSAWARLMEPPDR